MSWQNLHVQTHRDVYEPCDDTWLLATEVQANLKTEDSFLEVGCGAGLVSMAAAQVCRLAVATDMNPFAVNLAAQNAKKNGLTLHAVQTDLMAGLHHPFDVVAFNPPYLPTTEEDKVEGPLNLAFDGGETGLDTVLEFVKQLWWQPRVILIVHSSLAPTAPLVEALKELGYRDEVVAQHKDFYEAIFVRRFTCA